METKLQDKDTVLLQAQRLVDDVHAKLSLERQSSALKIRELGQTAANLQKRALVQRFLSHVQYSIKQHRIEEVVADNETLLGNQRNLQQAVCGLREELRDVEV